MEAVCSLVVLALKEDEEPQMTFLRWIFKNWKGKHQFVIICRLFVKTIWTEGSPLMVSTAPINPFLVGEYIFRVSCTWKENSFHIWQETYQVLLFGQMPLMPCMRPRKREDAFCWILLFGQNERTVNLKFICSNDCCKNWV